MLVFDNNKYRGFLAGVAGVIILASTCGCQRGLVGGERAEDERVVAKVNDYEIEVSDVTYAADLAGAGKGFPFESPEFPKAREDLLETLITRKALIQEAQKQDFDKQKEFMKEIERYWEQALLKFLIKKKLREFYYSVYIEEPEVKEEYRRRGHKIFAELVIFNDKAAAKELSAAGSDFDKVKEKLRDRVVLEEPAQWWEFGELPKDLEDHLFSLKPGDISKAIGYEDNWAVIRVLKVKDIEMVSFEVLAPHIIRDMVERRTGEMLEEWIRDVRNKADVEIKYDVLEEIELEKQ